MHVNIICPVNAEQIRPGEQVFGVSLPDCYSSERSQSLPVKEKELAPKEILKLD